MLAAGVTVRLDPMTTQRSAFSAWPKLVSSVSVWCVCVCGEDGGGGGRVGRVGGRCLQKTRRWYISYIPSGRFSPKWIIVSKSSPRQLGSSHLFTAEHTHTIDVVYVCSVS